MPDSTAIVLYHFNDVWGQLQKNHPVHELGNKIILLTAQMTKLTGRILDPPSLEYKEIGKKRNLVTISKANPGSWRQDKNQYLDGCKVLTTDKICSNGNNLILTGGELGNSRHVQVGRIAGEGGGARVRQHWEGEWNRFHQ